MTAEISLMMNPPKLVIFDCDGVLVDSESLIERAFLRVMEGHGLRLGPDDHLDTFKGLSTGRAVDILKTIWEVSLPVDIEEIIESAEWEEMERGLQPVPGAIDAVRSVVAAGMAVCVGSNGAPDAIAHRLRLTGLHHWFEDRLFSAAMVAHGKPYPDVFLHAAETMGFPPSECVVVEDSDAGVQAGLLAGMRVLAYVASPSSNIAASREVERFMDMASLPALLGVDDAEGWSSSGS